MALTSVIFFVVLGETDLLLMVPARMYSSTTGFTLLAIPFFILVGNLMNTGGMTQRIFRLAQCMVGHIKGGLGHVNVVNSMIFAGMSGSAIADAAGIGMVELEAMVASRVSPADSRRRHRRLIHHRSHYPPQHPLCHLREHDRHLGRPALPRWLHPRDSHGHLHDGHRLHHLRPKGLPERSEGPLSANWLSSTLDAWSALLCPVIIIGGILVGIFTPTEASVVAAVYALIVTMVIYREITLRDLPRILWETMEHTVRVMFIISAAGIFGWLLIQQKVPEAVINGLMALSGQSLGHSPDHQYHPPHPRLLHGSHLHHDL